MGALCGKESKSDNFQGQGRPLGAAPEERPTAPLPPNKRAGATIGGQGRTLGGGASGGAGSPSTSDDPGRKAAEAAQARAEAARGKGKLAADLYKRNAMPQSKLVSSEAEQREQQQSVDQKKQILNWD